jgi:hypothetical protein
MENRPSAAESNTARGFHPVSQNLATLCKNALWLFNRMNAEDFYRKDAKTRRRKDFDNLWAGFWKTRFSNAISGPALVNLDFAALRLSGFAPLR